MKEKGNLFDGRFFNSSVLCAAILKAMKRHHLLSPVASASLFVLFSFLAASWSFASDEFRVSQIHETRSQNLIQVGSSWRKDLPRRIMAALYVDHDTPADSIFVKAYFYDHNNTLITSRSAPSKVWMATPHGFESIGLPSVLKSGSPTDIYFAIDEPLQVKPWDSVVIVFGNASNIVADSYPASAIETVSFPEKDRIKPVTRN